MAVSSRQDVGAQMSELDFELKMSSRRLLWRMGFSTRIDVPLRAISGTRPQSAGGRRAPESYTDLDVLGLAIAPDAKVRSSIVDCKTGASSSISRMFWVRGLQDFFAADDALVVRERPISRDARQLAHRLGLTALTGAEVATLEALHPSEVPLDESPLSFLFDSKYMARVMQRSVGLDSRLDPLIEYKQLDYWVYPEHQNLLKLVETLRGSGKVLDPSSPIHTGLVLDCAWLYVVSAAHAIQEIRTVHISDLAHGLSQYLAGGPSQLRQKIEVSEMLGALQIDKKIPASVSVDINPPYFAELLELIARLLRRGNLLNDVLRLLEVQQTLAIGGDRIPAEVAFGSSYSRIAGKLAHDVVTFLVNASGIPTAFADTSRDLLLGKQDATPPPTKSTSNVGSVEKSATATTLFDGQ